MNAGARRLVLPSICFAPFPVTNPFASMPC